MLSRSTLRWRLAPPLPRPLPPLPRPDMVETLVVLNEVWRRSGGCWSFASMLLDFLHSNLRLISQAQISQARFLAEQ